MHTSTPHFLLFTESACGGCRGPRWRFVLQSVDDGSRLSASDVEPGDRRGRLELLAVVRGLEALDQPSRVTLVTRSRYVGCGVARCMSEWRDHGWRWERFGKLVPIRDHDLWKRLDRALAIHEVECCLWKFSLANDAGRDAGGEYGRAKSMAVDPRRQIAAAACSGERSPGRPSRQRNPLRLGGALREVVESIGQTVFGGVAGARAAS